MSIKYTKNKFFNGLLCNNSIRSIIWMLQKSQRIADNSLNVFWNILWYIFIWIIKQSVHLLNNLRVVLLVINIEFTVVKKNMCINEHLQFSSVRSLSGVQHFVTPWTAGRQAPLFITNSGVHSDSRPLSQWCHPAISSSVVPFSSCPQSLPASESFPMSQFFAWGGQSTRVSALASFLPKNTQIWSPSEWIGLISLQSKGVSRVFSNTTLQKHQFFSDQLSL